MSKELVDELTTEECHLFYSIKEPAPYVIYKGKGALRVALKKGTLDIEKGRDGRTFAFTNKGCVFLHFCNAIGPRSYDWDNKVVVALNEHEIGDLFLCLTRGTPIEFFHDKNLGKPDQGKFTKKVTFRPTDDKNAIMANCFVKDGDNQITMNAVPIHRKEMVALSELLRSAFSKTMGW